MTEWELLSHRLRRTCDRLAWGFGELKRVLMERGAWPATTAYAVASDGTKWKVTGTRLHLQTDNAAANSLLFPESECLWGILQLPDMLRKDVAASVSEALWRVSPLPTDQIVAGWWAEPNAQAGWTVNWGICRRSDVERTLLQHQLDVNASVYLMHKGGAVVVPPTGSLKQGGRQSWMDAVGLVSVIFFLLAVTLPALMPLILKRQAVVLAVDHVRELEVKAVPLRPKLDELRQQAEVAEGLRRNTDIDMPLASVINGLSVAMPTDTWLDRVEVNGREIRVTGLTNNATELIAHLAKQPLLMDVRATAANVRDSALNKERFAFEMHWRGDAAKQ